MPKVVHDPDNKRCKLETNKRTLDMHVPGGGVHCGSGEGAGLCLLFAGMYTATTAIVSGSFVLIGNTIHWLEKQGKCEDTLVVEANKAHVDNLLKSGGELLDITMEED